MFLKKRKFSEVGQLSNDRTSSFTGWHFLGFVGDAIILSADIPGMRFTF